MRKGLFLTVLSVLAVLLSGCSTSAPQPPPEPAVTQPALFVEMQDKTDKITQAGGLAALGAAQSKSLNLALNMAKKNGRLQLARVLKSEMIVLAKAFAEEKDIPYNSPLMAGFRDAARMIIQQNLASCDASELRHETSGEMTAAYAIMALDPQTVADQLAQDSDIWPQLESSKAFDLLNRKIEAYRDFKTAHETSL
jgi:hypothetical protein